MKKSVIDLKDLQDIAPYFKSKIGASIGKKLLKWFGIEKVNDVHKANCHLRGCSFTTSLLKDLGVSYKLHHAERLKELPEGAFVTVSNHPFGHIDGIMLIDIFAKIRPDFTVMVNGFLTKIGAMSQNFVAVKPDTKKRGANLANVSGVRGALSQLANNHPMGFFPAGAMSFYSCKERGIRDINWAPSVIRLIKRSKKIVYPVYFEGRNSVLFYLLGWIDWRVRTLRVAEEAFNKRGHCYNVYIGAPISVEKQASFETDEAFAAYLYQKTYELAPKRK